MTITERRAFHIKETAKWDAGIIGFAKSYGSTAVNTGFKERPGNNQGSNLGSIEAGIGIITLAVMT